MEEKKDKSGREVNESQENKIVINKDSSLFSYKVENKEVLKKEQRPLKKVFIGFFCILFILVVGLIIYSKHLLGYIDYKKFEDTANNIVVQKEEFDQDDNATNSKLDKLDPKDVQWNNSGEIKKVKGITNILFVAEEKEPDEYRGRSDVIMIATINTKDNTLKFTSILRDTYVQIPGYRDNRINSAFRTGDIPLLEQTIQENFNIQVDGYVQVNFDGFTKLIDELGGVEITLTEEEADWLNSGNHIRDKESRNLTAGTHRLNGAQALGYTRIRKINTIDGISYDFGRVWRQKLVLTNLFNDYKDQSLTKIVALAPKILSLISTDIGESKIMSLTMTALDLDVDKIETLTIPIEGSYQASLIRRMEVLVPDLEENISAINSFIYGKEFATEGYLDKDIEDYQIDFSLKSSNFKLKSIDSVTEAALDHLKGYRELTLADVLKVRYTKKNK